MAKLILILLTWPLGIFVSFSIIVEGFRQDPYALAVHEMLFIFIAGILMALSIFFSTPVIGNLFSAIRHIVYYLLVAAFASFLNFLFFILSYFQNVGYDSQNLMAIGISALSFVPFFGAFILCREIRAKYV